MLMWADTIRPPNAKQRARMIYYLLILALTCISADYKAIFVFLLQALTPSISIGPTWRAACQAVDQRGSSTVGSSHIERSVCNSAKSVHVMARDIGVLRERFHSFIGHRTRFFAGGSLVDPSFRGIRTCGIGSLPVLLRTARQLLRAYRAAR